jgi:cytochrome c oxidase subunit II
LLIGRIQLCSLLILCTAVLSSCSRKQPASAVHLAVTMRKFVIKPNVIHVKQGENVVLDVSSKDVQHGFQVEQLGINEPVQPGRPVAIALDTSKKGQFRMECSIICGAGHDDMTGKIVVE